MKSIKAQVTIFIIVGLIILIIFALLLYLKNTMANQDQKQSIEAVGRMIREYMKYDTYFGGCMEQATRESLELAGMQGGVIYDFQASDTKYFFGPTNGYPYGRYMIPYTYKDIQHNVSYGITMPRLGTQFHPNLPLYPYGLTNLVTNPKVLNPSYINTLGNYPKNPMTPLCDYYGNNRRELSDETACETYDSKSESDHNSIQEFLQTYIENRSINCIRLESIEGLNKYDVTMGNITANVTFGEHHVEANIVFPIKIKISRLTSELLLEKFHVKYNVRLKKIHELVSHLIERDVNNVFFDIVRDAPTVNDCKDITGGNSVCLKPGMSIHKINNVCLGTGLCETGNYDDILFIVDNNSTLDGLDYIFQFAIQNRPPALDLIKEVEGIGSYYFDYITYVGEEIVIEPTGIDPDEDQHNSNGEMDYTYFYYGWKETQDAYFDCPAGGCDIYDESFVVTYDDPVHNWTTSAMYIDTQRSASYTTEVQDLGVHKVKIEVCDESSTCDMQIIKILVIEGAYAAGLNTYDDILPGYASIEDPYIFFSPITKDFFTDNNGDQLQYVWQLTPGINPPWPAITEFERYYLPTSSYDLIDITTKMSPFFTGIGSYDISVNIENKTDGSLVSIGDATTIEVKACLPHRSAFPMFPYNVSDGFEANHSCCIGDPLDPSQPNWGTITSGNVCFSNVEYGCHDSTYNDLGAIPSTDHKGYTVPNNDIYKRDFSRVCDGLRGNTCEGAISDTLVHLKECTECQKCVYNETEEPDCEDIPPGSVICNNVRTCTSGPGQLYEGNFGPWSCEATCGEGVCNTSVNCNCDITTCGAICDSESEASYIWRDKECFYNCNDYLTGFPLTDCNYHSGVELKCSSPDPTDSACNLVDGKMVCPSDETYFADIDSTSPFYETFCRAEGFCYYNVSCTGAGIAEVQGDECLPAGDVSGDICYYHTSGSTVCDDSGNCDGWEDFDDITTCDSGSAETGDCLVGEFCYNTTCRPDSGWDPIPDSDITLDGNDFDCGAISCTTGYYKDSDVCYNGISCTQTGWQYSAEADKPASSCPIPSQNWFCGPSGWYCSY